MANNEIKVTIKADNKPFLESIKQCTNEIKKFSQTANSMNIDTGKIAKAEIAIKKLSDALNSIKDGKSINVDANVSQAMSALHEVANLSKSIQELKINVGVDKSQALADIEHIQQSLTKISSSMANVTVDNSQAIQAAEKIQKSLAGLKDGKIDIGIDKSNALEEIKKLSSELKKVKAAKINVKVNGSSTAKEELKKISTAIKTVRKAISTITVRVNAKSALNNIEKLISASRKLRTELNQLKLPANIGSGVVVSQLKQVAAMNREILSTMKQLSAESKKTVNVGNVGRSTESTLSKLGNLSLIASGVEQVFSTVRDIAASIVMPGFNFTKDMEMNQLGIAGTLQSMTLLNGEAVSFSDAMSISSDMMKKLQRDAIMTSATTEEMVTTFRALLAPGIGAGMSIDEIEEFTKVGVNAVKAMGLNSTQFVQELRDLVQGGIQPASSTLATSLGLTDEDIKKAKASSEGLFKFLMNRMNFKEMAEKLPDTLEGQMSQLKEVSTLASAEITEAFEDDFKDVVKIITSLIATVNTETGEVTINPAIIEFIDDLKSGVGDVIDLLGTVDEKTGKFEFDTDIIEFVDELGRGIASVCELLESLFTLTDKVFNNDSFSLVKDYWIPVFADLWDMTVDIVDIFKDAIIVLGNLSDKAIGAVAPFQKEFSGAIMWAVEKLKEFVNISKQGWDMLVKLSGGNLEDKKEKSTDWWMPFAKNFAQKNKPQVNTNNITSKFGDKGQEDAAKKAQKEAEKQMKLDLKEAELFYKVKTNQLKAEKEALEQSRNDTNNIQEYAQKIAQIERSIIDAEIAKVTTKIDIISNGPAENEREKSLEIEQLNIELQELRVKAQNAGLALSELSNMAKVSGNDVVGAAESLLGIAYGTGEGELVCTQYVKAAWEKAGVSMANELSDWVPTMMDQAKEKGLWRNVDSGYIPKAGDGIIVNGDNHVGISDGKGGIYHASSSRGTVHDASVEDTFGTPTAYIAMPEISESTTKKATQDTAKKFYQEYQKMIEEGNKILEEAAMIVGDISSNQKKEIEKQYNELIAKFKNNGQVGFANAAEKVKTNKLLELDFAQTQKELEYANNDLVDYQEKLFYELAEGSKDSLQVTKEYTKKYYELMDSRISELKVQLAEALKGDNKDLIIDIKKKLREVITTLSEGIQAILDKIDAEANEEIEKIQMNKRMTSRQKDDAVDAVKRGAIEKKRNTLQSDLVAWQTLKESGNQERIYDFENRKNLSIDEAILQAEEKLEQLNYQLSQTPTLLDDIQLAGRQAFEDGLLDFLTEGILECESLGDAFLNLAITVLQAIQKMYAEALTKNIMSALFPTDSGFNIPGSGVSRPAGVQGPLRPDGSFAEGGYVVGEGTGTSDSVLAALSNGEFVINAAAVKQVGLDTLHRINSGRAFNISMPKFAMGGLVGNAVSETAMRSAHEGFNSFSTNLATNFSPNTNVDVRISERALMNAMDETIKTQAKTYFRKEMMDNMKMYTQLGKRFR